MAWFYDCLILSLKLWSQHRTRYTKGAPSMKGNGSLNPINWFPLIFSYLIHSDENVSRVWWYSLRTQGGSWYVLWQVLGGCHRSCQAWRCLVLLRLTVFSLQPTSNQGLRYTVSWLEVSLAQLLSWKNELTIGRSRAGPFCGGRSAVVRVTAQNIQCEERRFGGAQTEIVSF